MPRKSPGGRRYDRGEYWWYGNCLYDGGKFTGYVIRHDGEDGWRVILPDGQATELGLRHEAMDVAVELASGVRPSSNRMYPG